MQPISAARRVTQASHTKCMASDAHARVHEDREDEPCKLSSACAEQRQRAEATRWRRSDSNMNRLRRSDECLRTSQLTDVPRCLLEENGLRSRRPPTRFPHDLEACCSSVTTRYAITWARVELCKRHKSPSSVARRELSIDLTWLAQRPKPEFPPLRSDPRIGHILGGGGDNTGQNCGGLPWGRLIGRCRRHPGDDGLHL